MVHSTKPLGNERLSMCQILSLGESECKIKANRKSFSFLAIISRGE
jgi:hypothetical protein